MMMPTSRRSSSSSRRGVGALVQLAEHLVVGQAAVVDQELPARPSDEAPQPDTRVLGADDEVGSGRPEFLAPVGIGLDETLRLAHDGCFPRHHAEAAALADVEARVVESQDEQGLPVDQQELAVVTDHVVIGPRHQGFIRCFSVMYDCRSPWDCWTSSAAS
jgi:hypothetical protein